MITDSYAQIELSLVLLHSNNLGNKDMKKSDAFHIFEQAPNWPSIPPWWTLTSPQVAALLTITPETLHIKRTQGVAPQAISAGAIKPAQGQPVFFRLAHVRAWTVQKMGLSYSVTDQITDFMMDFFPDWHICDFPLDEQVKHFDTIFRKEERLLHFGKALENFDSQLILAWGDHFAKQPKFVGNHMAYFDLQYDLLITEVPRGYNSPLTPRQLAG